MPGKDITPPALQKGDTIAFLSPSNRLNTLFSTRLSRAHSFFQNHGFRTLEIFTPIPTDLSPPTYLSTLHHRATELNSAFANPAIKAIICTIGGLSAYSILPFLDWETIKRNPKIFVGYSDITILHHAIYTKTGLRTFYGPAAIPSFGEFPRPQGCTVEHFFGTVMKENVVVKEDLDGKALNGKAIVVPRSKEWCPEWVDWLSEESETRARKTTPSPGWKWLRKGRKARGSLYGGCLPSIVQLTGTQYLPSDFYQGKILFLETPELGAPNAAFPVEFARCAMVDLRNAGILEGIVGLVLGRPFMYDEKMTMEFEKMVVDVCYGLDFPILAGVDVGHTDPVLTLALGVMAVLDSEQDSFVLEESAVC